MKYKHDKAKCFVCVILSHGCGEFMKTVEFIENGELKKEEQLVKKDGIYGSDLKPIATEDIVDLFSDKNTCGALSEKPRLFFIQACRGEKFDDGFLVNSNGNNKDTTREGSGKDSVDTFPLENEKNNMTDPCAIPQGGVGGIRQKETIEPVTSFTPQPIPEECPPVMCSFPLQQCFLVMYAAPPGYYAMRNPKEGSWFVMELTALFRRCHKSPGENVSLLRGLTAVIREVAKKEGKVKVPKMEGNKEVVEEIYRKQTPIINTMLFKDIFLP